VIDLFENKCVEFKKKKDEKSEYTSIFFPETYYFQNNPGMVLFSKKEFQNFFFSKKN
jgi:hypothetical protein